MTPLELCSNAVQYSSPPRRIRISYRQDEKNHYVSVRDNGIGMTGETREAIFLPFYIGDGNKTSRKYGRIGPGLPITKRLAEFSGGEIRVESELAHRSRSPLSCHETPADTPAAGCMPCSPVMHNAKHHPV